MSDEVQDDDAADVPQPELIADLCRTASRFVFKMVSSSTFANVPAGCSRRSSVVSASGLVDDDVPARLEPDLSAQGAGDLDLHA